MNEVEKKEIEERTELTQIIENYMASGFTLYGLALTICNAGYGKVEDYKKEIERLKEENSFIITARQDGKSAQVRNYICKIVQQAIKEFAKFLIDNADKNNTIKTSELPDLIKEYGDEK